MQKRETLDNNDFTTALHDGVQTHLFGSTLEELDSDAGLLRTVGRYIHFNSTFGSGVSNLAGEIGSRQDLFRDLSERVEMVADRSSEVAASVFSAAIDEFGDRTLSRAQTHRSLAQATLKGIARFFEYDLHVTNELTRPNQSTLKAIQDVRDGYGLNQCLDEQRIFSGIGFHICSELLATEEFRALDRFLGQRYPDMVHHLETTDVEINGQSTNSYRWVAIHTCIEVDHYHQAVNAGNLALRFYAGENTQTEIKYWILEGFRLFAGVQSKFMKGLLER